MIDKNILINFSPLIAVFFFSLIVSGCSMMTGIPLTDKKWGAGKDTNICFFNNKEILFARKDSTELSYVVRQKLVKRFA